MDIKIRNEKEADYLQIKKVNDLAFKQENEGILVDKLRQNPKFIGELSIVAVFEDKVIGHILFFPINIKDNEKTYPSLALAPMSVIPEFQSRGIGGQLIEYGLDRAKRLGFKSVIVLGHKDYYPKFGFKTASRWNIKAPFDLPDDVFMAMELLENGLRGISGVAEYPKEFEEVG